MDKQEEQIKTVKVKCGFCKGIGKIDMASIDEEQNLVMTCNYCDGTGYFYEVIDVHK